MKRPITVLAAVAILGMCSVYADYSFTNEGAWPASWPKEIEGLRKQSRTFEGPLVLYMHYSIPFTKREDFESAWPHLLKVRTPGAPIIMRRGPSFWLGGDSNAGVCIHTPPRGEDPIPEFKKGGRLEQTVYIELIVDGSIVDLNRIPLPPDTPISDERFKDALPQSR